MSQTGEDYTLRFKEGSWNSFDHSDHLYIKAPPTNKVVQEIFAIKIRINYYKQDNAIQVSDGILIDGCIQYNTILICIE